MAELTFGGPFELGLHFADGGRVWGGLSYLLPLLADLSLQLRELAGGRLWGHDTGVRLYPSAR